MGIFALALTQGPEYPLETRSLSWNGSASIAWNRALRCASRTS